MIRIESRNCDDIRVVHEYQSVDAMLADWNSEDPTIGDNHILLVVKDGMALYSSMGRKEETYDETLRTSDVMDWFRPVQA